MTHCKTIVVIGACAFAGAIGFGLRSVLAEGIPSPTPLYYSGTLTEGSAPANGTRAITVNLWSNSSATATQLCQTAASPTVVNGRFRVQLNAQCKSAINANPNATVEVLDNGVSLGGKAAIGAVPYAVEADHALNATNAANAATAAYAADAGNVPMITAWQSYTPTFQTTDGVAINNSQARGAYRRVGDTLEYVINITFTGASGSVSSHDWEASLPSGLQVDTSPLGNGNYPASGGGYSGVAGTPGLGINAAFSGNWLIFGAVGQLGDLNTSYPSSGWAAGGGFQVAGRVPITGWTVTH